MLKFRSFLMAKNLANCLSTIILKSVTATFMLLEICASSLQSAINAQTGGAQRIELCCNLEQGGLTPSHGTIQLARQALAIEIFVLIRPRAGDFTYTELELTQMQADISFCKSIGIDGVVFGVLDAQNKIDEARNKQLIELARPMQTTFHRAFDCLTNPLQGLKQVIYLGFDRILTSGLAPTAIEGKILLKELITQAQNNITILPGSGLNSQNVADFIAFTKAKEIHASAKKTILPVTDSLFSAPYYETDVEEVQRLIAIL